jgi:predicted GNAT superfamily acetyltransferase
MNDMKQCEAIQKEVWGFIELDVVPAGLMAVMGHYGAVTAGAFIGARMAGFVCGFPGFAEGKPFHHSHMLAVRPEFQGAGIGLALKWAQADRVLAQGIRRVNWTFDPLQARNANLNINRLGCISSVYRLNVYGNSQSPLHGGIPTDRLEPDWRLDSERVARARRDELIPSPGIPDLPGVNRITFRDDGMPEPGDITVPTPAAGASDVLFFIPPDINEVMRTDIGLAMTWRLKSREALSGLFEHGYEVIGFHRQGRDAAYRLRRNAR